MSIHETKQNNPKVLLSSVHQPVHGNTILNIDLNINLGVVDTAKKLSEEQVDNIKRTVEIVFKEFNKSQQKNRIIPKTKRLKK